MILNRVTVLSRLAKQRDKPTRRKSEEMIDLLKVSRHEIIEDKDIWENNKHRLRFRKFPWPFWVVGALWILGACYLIYAMYEHLFPF